MTQFIVATGDSRTLNFPAGIGTRPISDASVAQAASLLFPGEICFQVFDLASGEADRFFDDLHDCLTTPGDEAPDRLPVIVALEALVRDGRSVACWYAEYHSDLPLLHTWDAFMRELRQQALQMPPEAYAIIRPESG